MNIMSKEKKEYVCEKKCGYRTTRKGNYLNHISRKFPCDGKIIQNNNNTVSNNSLIEELKLVKLEMEKYKLKNKELEKELKEERKSKNESIKELITTNKNLSNETKILKESIINKYDYE